MHHEDRAGVNAFIRGIDRIANAKLPAAVIMCTNRLSALDPAVRRRAADVLSFARPNDEQRRVVLSSLVWNRFGLSPSPYRRASRRHRAATRAGVRLHLLGPDPAPSAQRSSSTPIRPGASTARARSRSPET